MQPILQELVQFQSYLRRRRYHQKKVQDRYHHHLNQECSSRPEPCTEQLAEWPRIPNQNFWYPCPSSSSSPALLFAWIAPMWVLDSRFWVKLLLYDSHSMKVKSGVIGENLLKSLQLTTVPDIKFQSSTKFSSNNKTCFQWLEFNKCFFALSSSAWSYEDK